MLEYVGDTDREHFVVLCFDTQNQPTCIQTVHIGILNTSIVHPHEVLESAILSNAASIIVGRNHPSDICEPSVTNRLKTAGEIGGIELLDNIIICSKKFNSLKEQVYFNIGGYYEEKDFKAYRYYNCP